MYTLITNMFIHAERVFVLRLLMEGCDEYMNLTPFKNLLKYLIEVIRIT